MPHVSLLWPSFGTQKLGVCTSDGSLDLTADEQIDRFFVDPAAHCVGYGRLEDEPTARRLVLED